MDGYTASEPGPTTFAMQESSHAFFGNAELPFADFIAERAQAYDIPIEMIIDWPNFSSDDGPFYGFVPHVRFAFGSNRIGGTFHSPYDTIEIVQDQGEVMEQSVSMALSAALELPQDGDLRVTPEPERRALIIATHTEVLHMAPPMLISLDRALAWEGFDVDVIPYGQSPTAEDLADSDLVLVLPVIDYPGADGDPSLYDEEWSVDEIDRLVTYVDQGGFLVLVNSANRLSFGTIADANEDWDGVNALAAPFGVSYGGDPFPGNTAYFAGTHRLAENLPRMGMVSGNGLPISLQAGEILAESGRQAALALVSYGAAGGEVLVLSDLGSLEVYGAVDPDENSLTFLFVLNLASYAGDR
jgi:hypothetical protein